MSEKLVLPRFDVPRDSTRIAMRTLWAMGGVVVLATLVLGLAMWRHQALEIATAEEAAAKAAAKVAAAKAAELKAAQPKPVVAAQLARAADKTGAPALGAGSMGAAGATTLASVTPSAAGTETVAATAPKLRRSAKSTSRSRSAARGAVLPELSGGKSAKAPKSKANQKSNDDVIDRLLNKYK